MDNMIKLPVIENARNDVMKPRFSQIHMFLNKYRCYTNQRKRLQYNYTEKVRVKKKIF